MSDPNAYPLRWPQGWPRTALPGKSAFSSRTVFAAITELEKQLKFLGAERIVISSNVTLSTQAPKDKGVCVYFFLKGRPYALPCDKWSHVEENIWALAKHIEGLRASERWGVGTVARVFEGYAALPPPGSSAGASWWDVLGVSADCSQVAARSAYIAKAKDCHPDNGGSSDAMVKLNAAWDQARAHFTK